MTPTPHHGCECCTPAPELGRLVAHRAPVAGPRQRVERPATTARQHAELLVVGRVVTMDDARPEVQAIAVADGRIVAVGSRDELDGLRAPSTEVLDLGDHVVLPGFVEPHLHLWVTALVDGWIDCSPMTHASFDAILDALRSAPPSAEHGGWVLGQLYDPSLLPGEPDLTREVLDRVVPDHPCVVMNASMHFAYANSRAFAAAHIDDHAPDPPGGVYQRANGRLTGVVGEIAAITPLLGALPQVDHDRFLDAVVRVAASAAAAGVTKVHEAATGALFGVAELDMLHGLAGAGRLPVRVTTAQLDTARAAFEGAGLEPGAGDDLVRAISWKVVSDGSNQGRSGFQRVDYLGTDSRGRLNYSPEELAEIVGYAHSHGWQVMVHANGGAAVDLAVAAYEAALAGAAPHDLRHRIEHCSFADDDDLRRMAALGVSPSFLMNHVYYWGRALRDDLLGPDVASGLDPVATARRHGHRISFHSDFNVTPIAPLRSVQTAVTRVMRDGGDVLDPSECDSAAAALRAVTIDAAWQTHTDDVLGSLEVGKYADLVVLGDDPRTVDPHDIAGIDVLATYLGGKPAWSS